MLKFFSKIFKNRKISKCSKIDYFSSILLKRARDWNEMCLCRFLTEKNFGKFFEKFSTPRNIIKNQHFPPKNRRCAWCATCVHIRHMCLRASKNQTSASYLFNKPSRTSGRHILTILSQKKSGQIWKNLNYMPLISPLLFCPSPFFLAKNFENFKNWKCFVWAKDTLRTICIPSS